MNPLQFPHKPPVCEACTIKSQWGPILFWTPMTFILWIKTVLQIKYLHNILICVLQNKESLQVWNDMRMRVSK